MSFPTTVRETNPIDFKHDELNIQRTVPWNVPDLHIWRLRLISDSGCGWWDVSYCYGSILGENVRVELPFDQLKKGAGVARQIVEAGRKDGVYVKDLGILENISCLY